MAGSPPRGSVARVRVSRSSLAAVARRPGARAAADPQPARSRTAARSPSASRGRRGAMGIRVVGVHAAGRAPARRRRRGTRHRLVPRRRRADRGRAARRAPTPSIPGTGSWPRIRTFARARRRLRGWRGSGRPPSAIAAMGDKAAARRRAAAHGVPTVPGYDGDGAGRRDAGGAKPSASATRCSSSRRPAAAARACAWSRGAAELAEALAAARREAQRVLRRRSAHPRALPRRARATSRSRCCSTRTAPASTSASATARRSGATRRSSRRRRRPRSRPSCGRGWARPRWRSPAAVGYVERRHGRDAPDRRRRVLLPRDEHAPPGRASGHRGGHRARPRRATSCASPAARRWPSSGCRRRRAIRGHAIEARLYAEDPESGFLPGHRPPARAVAGRTGVRVDTGVREGDEVSDRYDPMLAKLIAHGRDPRRGAGRAAASARRDGDPRRAHEPALPALAARPARHARRRDADRYDRRRSRCRRPRRRTRRTGGRPRSRSTTGIDGPVGRRLAAQRRARPCACATATRSAPSTARRTRERVRPIAVRDGDTRPRRRRRPVARVRLAPPPTIEEAVRHASRPVARARSAPDRADAGAGHRRARRRGRIGQRAPGRSWSSRR